MINQLRTFGSPTRVVIWWLIFLAIPVGIVLILTGSEHAGIPTILAANAVVFLLVILEKKP